MATEFTETELKTIYAALSNVQAIIWFDPKGNILDANENFAATVGYSIDELIGQSHRMFVDPAYANSAEYKAFWDDLARGEAISDKFQRVAKDGSPIFIEASYNPIRDETGAVVKVVKFAIDVTEQTLKDAMTQGKHEAITRALGVIEFDMDGKVQWANDNFLSVVGYGLNEVQGKHHSMFLEQSYAQSAEYQQFWADLRAGKNHTAEFKRVGKGGKPVWIQAGYSGIKGPNGDIVRIIKYAIDVTSNHEASDMISNVLVSLSEGDLTARVPNGIAPEFRKVRDVFNQTMAHLEEMISGILAISHSIFTESEGITITADELNKRCEQQAATIEETSAAMAEISKTVQENTAKSQEASKSTDQAAKQAEDGGSIVQQAIEAMGKIEAGSAEIRKIISVIESIAFQTNLLALNAGVEAARAGDAGRGFAVVASEVRALAQRASEAARDINGLIETSGKEVAEGARLVNETGNALSGIVSSVAAVSDGMRTIHQASTEQDAAVSEVNQSISEIDLTTQQTAVVSEKNSATATMLTERAKELTSLIGIFGQQGGSKGTMQNAPSPRTPPQHAERPAPSRPSRPVARPAPVAASGSVVNAKSNEVEDDDDWSLF